jgi:hypothetical protein
MDFGDLTDAAPQSLLQALAQQVCEQLPDVKDGPDLMAEEMVDCLRKLAAEQDVYLMFDSTERFQSEQSFWRWLELNLVDPLVAETQTCLVFAGRVPAPWFSYVVKRAVYRLSLEPLPKEQAALELLKECLQICGPELDEAVIQSVVPLLYDLSFGHPRLSELLAEQAAARLQQDPPDPQQLEDHLRRTVIEGFVQDRFFKDLDSPWPQILTWASVLDEFDALTLERYAAHLKPLEALVENKRPNFFHRGISDMRNRYALVWQRGEGYSVHGILRDIVRSQFKALSPQKYKDACRAAAETYREFATIEPKETKAQAYRDKAAVYERRSHVDEKENPS